MLRISNHLERFYFGRLIALVAFVLCLASFDPAQGQQRGQKTFPSYEAACTALLSAVQQEGQSALLEILGPTAREIISGGDDIEDRNGRRKFVEKYREMHRLVREPDGTTTLYVGAENWPLPILLRFKANKWYFDPVASKAEILFRRIGRNELDTIAVCRELVSAQNEYHSEPHDDGVLQFAPTFMSDEGRHNGLYWKISTREPESPIGQLLALANSEGYAKETTRPRPFHGYYYRILNRQGRHASGGAKKYMVNGRMTGGFAFVAFPAEYRSSGVMTFIVNQDGIVYQKDLGAKTAIRARALTHYDPDASWTRVE
jgi:hypothetical protein